MNDVLNLRYFSEWCPRPAGAWPVVDPEIWVPRQRIFWRLIKAGSQANWDITANMKLSYIAWYAYILESTWNNLYLDGTAANCRMPLQSVVDFFCLLPTMLLILTFALQIGCDLPKPSILATNRQKQYLSFAMFIWAFLYFSIKWPCTTYQNWTCTLGLLWFKLTDIQAPCILHL